MSQRQINQAAFDAVVNHLLTQGQQSLRSADLGQMVKGQPRCLYRNPEGLKCAVGGIIDDRDYKPEMDDGTHGGTGIADLVIEHSFPNSPHMRAELNLLRELQYVHDGFAPKDWREQLRIVGGRNNLDMSCVDKHV